MFVYRLMYAPPFSLSQLELHTDISHTHSPTHTTIHHERKHNRANNLFADVDWVLAKQNAHKHKKMRQVQKKYGFEL